MDFRNLLVIEKKEKIGYPPTVKELQTIGKKLPQDPVNTHLH